MNEYANSKWVYVLIGLTVLSIIVWIITGTSQSDSDNKIMVNQVTSTTEFTEQESVAQTEETVTGYYLARAENDCVFVYWVDGTGEHLHYETTIAYPLLSLEDQEMLDEGIVLETDEELASFLENYDS